MIAVVNSSPIILLAKIGRLDLLRQLFDDVVIPRAVHGEITIGNDRLGAARLSSAPWIAVREPADQQGVEALLSELGRGEAEVIVLGEEVRRPATLLLDDAAGRRRALQRGLTVLGSAGVLALAKERNLIRLVP